MSFADAQLFNAVLALYGEPEPDAGESMDKVGERLRELATKKRADDAERAHQGWQDRSERRL